MNKIQQINTELHNILENVAKQFKEENISIVMPTYVPQRGEILQEFGGDSICLALDVVPSNDDFLIAINAWQEQSEQTLFETVSYYLQYGLKHMLCTDISRDGTLQGMNTKLYKDLAKTFASIQTQASGGLCDLDDLKNLNGVCGGIVAGKALLDGIFTVKEGIECLQNV